MKPSIKTKILIINLEESEDRRSSIQKYLDDYNISNYQFFPACSSKNTTDLRIELANGINRPHLGEKYTKHFNPSEIACLQSHIYALQYAKEAKLDYVIILEDDVVLCEDWNDRLDKLLKLTPKNWDHIYLSGQPNEKELNKNFNPLNLAPFLHVEKSINTMGAFSYIVKNTIYDKLIDKLYSLSLPVDDIVKNMILSNEIKSYTFYPFLSYHENDIQSTIWDKPIWEKKYAVDHASKRYYVKKL